MLTFVKLTTKIF